MTSPREERKTYTDDELKDAPPVAEIRGTTSASDAIAELGGYPIRNAAVPKGAPPNAPPSVPAPPIG
jgi:hypothetical protein